MDREKLKALTNAALGAQELGGFPQGGEPGEPGYGGDAEGYGKPGFPVLPGHEPSVGRGRKTCKNRDLTVGVKYHMRQLRLRGAFFAADIWRG